MNYSQTDENGVSNQGPMHCKDEHQVLGQKNSIKPKNLLWSHNEPLTDR